MSKITSKYQVTLPKAIAEEYGLKPGDDIEWVAAGEVIRVLPPAAQNPVEDRDSSLRLFDQGTARIRHRAKAAGRRTATTRGWTRGDLYTRGRSH